MVNFQKAQEAASDLLNMFGYSEPPIYIIRIVNDLGINVYFEDLNEKDRKPISGFFYYEKNAIYVNIDEFPRRQIFTIAHELGHKILHEEWLKSSEYGGLLKESIIYPTNPIDKEANIFAANLLVPRFMLYKYHKEYGITSVKKLADIFGVSEPVIVSRINDDM